MKKFLKFGVLVVLVTALFTGCGVAAIQNYDTTYTANSGSSITLDQVAEEIVAAGTTLGWQMRKQEDGLIIGTLYLRTHMAKVKIPYTTKDFNIIYEESANLNYDATNKTIHTNYNGWAQNLNNMIRTRLSNL